MAQKFAVAGATGHIGSVLAASLLAEGQQVIAIGRHADRLADLQSKGAELAIGNLEDVAFLTEVLSKVDAAFLLLPPDPQAQDFLAIQKVRGEAQIESIRKSGVKKVVFLSSHASNLLDRKIGPIRSTAEQEVRLKALHAELNGAFELTILRPTYFMENDFANMGQLLKGGVVYAGNHPDMLLSPIATHDIAIEIHKALTSANQSSDIQILTLIGPEDHKISDLVTLQAKALGVENHSYVQVPSAAVVQAMMGFGMSASVAGLYGEMIEGMEDNIFDLNGVDYRRTGTTYENWVGQAAQHMKG
jgi:uncharacterized protein YbjT (DUF2867 family)